MRKNFLPAVMKDVLTGKSSVLKADANPPIMMIHPLRDSNPWLASAKWDGGKPEAERIFADVFPSMVLAIKYQGPTVEDIVAKFLHYNYPILAALSFLMTAAVSLPFPTLYKALH